MGDVASPKTNLTDGLSLANFDLWSGVQNINRFPWEMEFDPYAALARMGYDDYSPFDVVLPWMNAGILRYDQYRKNDGEKYFREVAQVARVFKKREWGVVLLTFDGLPSQFEKKVALGPDVKPIVEGDAVDFFTEAVAVYIGPKLESRPYDDFSPALVPLVHPYGPPADFDPIRRSL